ncbi:hypothetical protein [Komagataeibacter nataicola]|uniref:hypothetical protein n=1 Tax=Komagataeibacter nataicola TaxID=265960 RepID=UPI001F2D0B08|nr:hypothetical protein [Komagataeibacter nataicola]WNM08369.1 hypothetical protein RI056_16150 [Komagataeibacter nataicola]
MAVEAYEIGVNLVANATRVTGPIGEMIEALERLISAQREAQMGFNGMVSSLGGARRLAGGMADDMERAARAARDIASSSGRFRGAPSSRSASGGDGGNAASRPAPAPPAPAMPPIPPENLGRGSYVSPYSAAATHVPGAPQLLLPPPEVRTPGTALMVLPNQGDSMGNGANFRAAVRPNGYDPNWTTPEYSMNGPHGPYPYLGPHAVNPGEVGEGLMAARGALSGIGMPRVGPLAAGMAAYAGIHGVGETLGAGFRQTGQYDQTFLSMQGDPVARANMSAIMASADKALRNNPFLTAPESAQIAQDAFELSGGNMEEQDPIAVLLNKVNRTFQAQGKSPEAAMAESKAFIRAQDISNRFYNPRTGEFDLDRATRSTESALAACRVGHFAADNAEADPAYAA